MGNRFRGEADEVDVTMMERATRGIAFGMCLSCASSPGGEGGAEDGSGTEDGGSTDGGDRTQTASAGPSTSQGTGTDSSTGSTGSGSSGDTGETEDTTDTGRAVAGDVYAWGSVDDEAGNDLLMVRLPNGGPPEVETLALDGQSVAAAALSPDGSTLAVLGYPEGTTAFGTSPDDRIPYFIDLYAADGSGPAIRRVDGTIAGPAWTSTIAFSSTGTHLAFAMERLSIVAVDGDDLPIEVADRPRTFAWHNDPDRAVLLAAIFEGTFPDYTNRLVKIDAELAPLIPIEVGVFQQVDAIQSDPAGPFYFAADVTDPDDFWSRVYRLGPDEASAEAVPDLNDPGGDSWSFGGFALSHAGDRLALCARTGELMQSFEDDTFVMDLDAGGPPQKQTPPGTVLGEGTPAWSPDDTMLAIRDNYEPPPEVEFEFYPFDVYVAPSSGAPEATRIFNLPVDVRPATMAFTASGQWLVVRLGQWTALGWEYSVVATDTLAEEDQDVQARQLFDAVPIASNPDPYGAAIMDFFVAEPGQLED